MTEDIIDLAEVLPDYTAPAWEEHQEVSGFAILLALPDVPDTLTLMAQTGMLPAAPEKPVTPESAPVTPPAPPPRAVAAYNRGSIAAAVQDWRGLTVAGVNELLPPGNRVQGDRDRQVVYSAANLALLIKFSPRFYLWVLGLLNQRAAALAREEAALKNSGATPSAGPTRGRGSAGGALKRKKRSA